MVFEPATFPLKDSQGPNWGAMLMAVIIVGGVGLIAYKFISNSNVPALKKNKNERLHTNRPK